MLLGVAAMVTKQRGDYREAESMFLFHVAVRTGSSSCCCRRRYRNDPQGTVLCNIVGQAFVERRVVVFVIVVVVLVVLPPFKCCCCCLDDLLSHMRNYRWRIFQSVCRDELWKTTRSISFNLV